MSLYGALYSGVSGLKAQSTKIGVISDNISNVNTVGYKGGTGIFSSLVTTSSTSAAYSPGGVLGSNRQLVSKQGLLQTTDSPTDVAISGSGFFIVNQSADQSGQVLYTRAGSFRQDSTGNFRNSAGYFLQAWPLDREGRLPGDPGNLDTTSSANLASLRTVNVQNLTGAAAATTSVSLGANLNAGQNVYAGSAGTVQMDSLHTINFGIAAKDIIIPGGVNSLTRGDKMVIETGGGQSYTYRYGGFTFTRDVTDSTSDGDNALDVLSSPTTLTDSATTLGSNPVTTGGAATGGAATDAAVTITETSHGYAVGDVITITGVPSAIDGIPAGQINGTHVITAVSTNAYTFATTSSPTTGGVAGGGASVTSENEPIKTTSSSSTVRIRHVDHGLVDGQVVTLSGLANDIGGIDNADLNDSFVVNVIDDDHYEIEAPSDATSTTGGGSGTSDNVSAITRSFAGNILDATTVTQTFLGTTGTSGFTSDALTFTISSTTAGTVTFTYTSASPNAQLGQFNNLTNLAAAINAQNGLSARVASGRLYVSATDANEALAFENGSIAGTEGPPVQQGIDWVRELGLDDQGAGTDRFSTLQGLENLADDAAGITGSIENPLGEAILTVNVDNPLDTITFSDLPVSSSYAMTFSSTPIATTDGSNTITLTFPEPHGLTSDDIIDLDVSAWGAGPFNGIPKSELSGLHTVVVVNSTTVTFEVTSEATASGDTGAASLTVTPPNNIGSVVAELGLVDSLNNATFTPQTTGALGPAYDPTDSDKNMASGNIASQFSRPVTIYDALGTGHDLTVTFIKTGVNTWAAEVFVVPEDDVTTSLPNGQIAYGTIIFNGDGSLRSVDPGLSEAIDITWTNGAVSSEVTFNWGTAGLPAGTDGATEIGLTDGLSQFNSAYKVNFVNQNGAPVGELIGVAVDESGYISASYSNGETQRLYKIALASFANPDQLQAISGNVYGQTNDSGEVNLRQPGTSGVGKVAASSLEASNVELADQLTDMIVAQRAYQANTKVISTADSLLSDLNRILQ